MVCLASVLHEEFAELSVEDRQKYLNDLVRVARKMSNIVDELLLLAQVSDAQWVNYLSNAIKYGGRPPRVELGGETQSNGMVRFWVRDNGPGIAPQDQARLFKPFTRLDHLRAQGYGLGLSVALHIVEKLGGQVGVKSVPGQGSIFSFTLPGSLAHDR
jgi:K+-sensing histidine kinase KdpD